MLTLLDNMNVFTIIHGCVRTQKYQITLHLKFLGSYIAS